MQKRTLRRFIVVIVAGAVSFLLLSPLTMTTAQQLAGAYTPVTDERLRSPAPEDWLMYRGTYDSWGYSPLDQITTENVSDLVPVWSVSTGVVSGHESPPIVNDGIMFVTTPEDQVLAVDARTGELLWRHRRELPEDLRQGHRTNRGVGLYVDRVFFTTHDAFVVALDAMSGAVAWERAVADYRAGYYMTMAPLVANGKVMVGPSGGERGIRGFVTALDPDTGDEVWKSYTIPGPGEPGNDTWPGDSWRTGGAPIWITGSFDPELNLTYWGTGNPGPWIGDARPGDNLYTNSVVAFDADTGELKSYHQYHWNGSWDWDEVSAPLLIDVPRGGRTVKSLVHPARNGYLWLLERAADAITFVDAVPYVYQNVFTDIDQQTGGPRTTRNGRPAQAAASRSVRRSGAARTGHQPPTVHRPAISTSRRTRTSAPIWRGNTSSMSRARASSARPGGPSSVTAPTTWGRYRCGISRPAKRSGPTSSSHRTGARS